jgi:hypothetical protein
MMTPEPVNDMMKYVQLKVLTLEAMIVTIN